MANQPSPSLWLFHQLGKSCSLKGTGCFKSQRARGSALNRSGREVVCLNEPLADRLRTGVKRGCGNWLLWVRSLASYKEKPYVSKTLARAAWPFTVRPPLSSRPTTADDKTPAANYPADGESLKWDCQSKGWPLCLWIWGRVKVGGKEAELQRHAFLKKEVDYQQN